jgi:Holliday junction DNA helicase RuvA
MIASIQGEVLEVASDGLVIAVGGLGIKVLVPAPLRDSTRQGEQVALQTYLVVREDALTLFGFETQEAREFFTLLLAVNGVGPRTALAILSVLSTDAIRRAVVSEQADIFARVPGVGHKTAQKILLGLQGRIKGEIGPLEAATTITGVEAEIIDALTSLGYSVVEAQAAVQAIPKDTPVDVETRLRLALQYFSK